MRNPPPDRGKELPGFVSKSLETDNAPRMAKHLGGSGEDVLCDMGLL